MLPFKNPSRHKVISELSIGVINIQNLVLPGSSGSKQASEIHATPKKRRHHIIVACVAGARKGKERVEIGRAREAQNKGKGSACS